MIGTYAAALLVIGASLPVGAAVLVLSGRSRWSWIAPALGLALITAAAWLLVRIPGEGLTALLGILALAVASALFAAPRFEFDRARWSEGLTVGALTLIAVSIPFIVEGHFGILGTGFNVDMSQHLFVADWLQTPLGPAPPLIDQGYPVGPHALAVAGAEIPGADLATAFTGVTIAVPVVGGLTALAGTRRLGSWRSPIAAVLVAIPYLVASYLAQGAFKELFEATFLLAFALWLHELDRAQARRWGFALPAAALGVGVIYAYSAPGIAWLVGAALVWGLAELVIDRDRALGMLRLAAPGIAIALLAFVVVLAPELGRVAEFGGSAGNVANAGDSEPRAGAGIVVGADFIDTDARGNRATIEVGVEEDAEQGRLDLFDNDLGNLFGDVPALEMLGLWPSGDFRVEPGDGAVPAVVFYLGALIGLAALAVGLWAAVVRRETALLAALAAAVLIWLAASALSTPYTTAKALQMIAPLLMLLSLRGVLDRRFSPGIGRSSVEPWALAGSALAAVFLLAAAGSSVLALANAPVGPERYTAGIGKLREQLTGEPVLLLAPPGQLNDRHGAAFYGWELRGARPICVAPSPEGDAGFAGPAPVGIRYVVTLGGKRAAPFDDVEEISRRKRIALWEVDEFDPTAAAPVPLDPGEPTSCKLGLDA